MIGDDCEAAICLLAMRFDRHTGPTPYFNRRDQYRMLGLVGLLALVMVLYQVVKQPENWWWFEALSQPESVPDDAPVAPSPPLKPFHVKRGGQSELLPGDATYARVDEEPSAVAGRGTTDESQPVESASPGTRGNEPAVESPTAETPATNATPFTAERVPAVLLEGVEDDRFQMTRREQPALQRVADYVRDLDPAAVRRFADPNVTFDVLLSDPDYYRGRPIAFEGRVKRLVPGRVGLQGQAVDVWEAWVLTPDSRETPWLVLCHEVPAGMPRGQGLDEQATIRGYFLRRYAYATVGGEAITPLVFAPTLEWRPAAPPASAEITRDFRLGALAFAGGLVLLVGLLVAWFLRSDRGYRRSRLHRIAESRLDAAPSELATLVALDAGDPHRIRIEESADQPDVASSAGPSPT